MEKKCKKIVWKERSCKNSFNQCVVVVGTNGI